jgi:hypothetical protein
MSTSALAIVNLDDGTGSAKYAKELVVAGTTALTGAAVNVTATLGFGVSTGQTRFIRFDLTNGKFKNAVVPANLTGPAAAIGPGTPVVSQGGTAGSTFVIYQITAQADIPQNAVVAFASGVVGLVPVDANASIQMAYSLYEDAPSAAAGGAAGRLNPNSAPQVVAGLVTGLAFATVPNDTVVDVAATPAYAKFIQGGAGTSTAVAQIGTVSSDAAAGVLDPLTGLQVAYAQLVAAGTKLLLTGSDLTTAVTPATTTTGIFLSGNGGTCAAGATAGLDRTATTATFLVDANPVVNRAICYSVPANNAAAIISQSFTVGLDAVSAVGATTADILPGPTAGTFTRNGLTLKAAFAETTGAAGVSTAVSLTNTSSLPAPYTVRCMLNNGSAPGTAGTVPANQSIRLGLSNSLGCTSNGTLRGLEINLATTPGSVIGSIVRQNTSTGQASFDAMTGNR